MGIELYCGIFQPDTRGREKLFESPSGIIGNTKTANLVYDGKQDVIKGRIVLANFITDSPLGRPFAKPMSFRDMVRYCNRNAEELDRKNIEVVLLLTEMWSVFQHYLDADNEAEVKNFNNRMRHLRARLRGDTQRYRDLPPLMRDAVSEIYIPYKMHDDGMVCRDPMCMEHHFSVCDRYFHDEFGHWLRQEVRRFDMDLVVNNYNAKRMKPIPEPGGSLFDD